MWEKLSGEKCLIVAVQVVLSQCAVMVLHVVPSSGEAHEASERTDRVWLVCGPMSVKNILMVTD
jgi:hypothetical protein